MAGADSLQYTAMKANYKAQGKSAGPAEDFVASRHGRSAHKKRKTSYPQEVFHFLKACCNLNGSC
jgi:hypothetical protein